MIRRTNLVILIIALLISCHQDEISEEQSKAFIKFFGNGDLVVTGMDVKQTADGGYVVLGNAIYEDETTDIYLIGTDENGNSLGWSPKLIGNQYNDEGNRIIVLSDGFLIFGTTDLSGNGQTDMYLVKTDPEGNVVWEKTIGGTSREEGYDIQVTATGDLILAGVTDDPVITTGNKSAYMLVTSSDASVIRKRGTISYLDFEAEARAIREITGGYMIIGTITNMAASSSDILLARSNESFTEILAKTAGRTRDDFGEDLYISSGGEVYILGSSNNPQTNISEVYFGQLESTLLEMTWTKILSEPGFGLEAKGMAYSDQGFFAITGSRLSVAEQDMMFLRLDNTGQELNRKFYGESGFQEGHAIHYTPADNGFIITGTNDFEVFSMAAMVKTGPDGNLD
ncbi:MAG: hypothetical protein AMS27_04235 [Bacteroides sp. SM23_62_1]|nr:MAG: hypothetical protein AMS27_04235 [Bacteroides sp. SM23_62_1]